MKANLVIVGGGPAGLAAAVSAWECGERDIVILERDNMLGGILNQCIHNGFGLHTFAEELTGPEYADRYIKKVKEYGIICQLETMVIDIDTSKVLTCVSPSKGLQMIEAKAIILACGCRERPRGAVNIAGSRVAGVYTAGMAQKLVNIDGKMTGKKIVIIGSGDIGLIMARRMVFEGAKVEAVVEIMAHSSGLNRNISQCLNDYDIPLLLSHTVLKIEGRQRAQSVTICKVNDKLEPMLETARVVECDCVLLSVGLLPENELAKKLGVNISGVTGGAIVDENMMTNIDGVFECGNVLHVHDLVDYVSQESQLAGVAAVEYLNKVKSSQQEKWQIVASDGVRYCVPFAINKDTTASCIALKMRVATVAKNVRLVLSCGATILSDQKKPIVRPGEMIVFNLEMRLLEQLKGADTIKVYLQSDKA